MKRSVIIVGFLALIIGAFAGSVLLGPSFAPAPDPLPPALPPVPVEITYRNAMFGNGYVVQFKGLSSKRLRVLVTLKNATTGEKQRGDLQIDPNVPSEIGWAEGFAFASGDTIDIAMAGHANVHFRIP